MDQKDNKKSGGFGFGNWGTFTPAPISGTTPQSGFGSFSLASPFTKKVEDPNNKKQDQTKKQQPQPSFGPNIFSNMPPMFGNSSPLFGKPTIDKSDTPKQSGISNTPFGTIFTKKDDNGKLNQTPMGSLFDNSNKLSAQKKQDKKSNPQRESTQNKGSLFGINPFLKSTFEKKNEEEKKQPKQETQKQQIPIAKQIEKTPENEQKQEQKKEKDPQSSQLESKDNPPSAPIKETSKSPFFSNAQNQNSLFSPFTKKPVPGSMTPIIEVASKEESGKSSNLSPEKRESPENQSVQIKIEEKEQEKKEEEKAQKPEIKEQKKEDKPFGFGFGGFGNSFPPSQLFTNNQNKGPPASQQKEQEKPTHTTPVFGPKKQPLFQDLKQNISLQKPKLIEFLERPIQQIKQDHSSPFVASEPDLTVQKQSREKFESMNRTSTIQNRPSRYVAPVIPPPSPQTPPQIPQPQKSSKEKSSSPISQQSKISSPKISYNSLQQTRNTILNKRNDSNVIDEEKICQYIETMLGFTLENEDQKLQKIEMVNILELKQVNMILNDFSKFICRKLRMNESSFFVVLKELKEMLSSQGLIDKLIKEGQKSLIQTGFYETSNIGQSTKYELVENEESLCLLDFFVEQYEQYIAKVLNKMTTGKFIKKLPPILFKKMLQLEARTVSEKQTSIQKSLDSKLVLLLSQRIQKYMKSFHIEKILGYQEFIEMVPLIEEIPAGRAGEIVQKVVLSLLRKDKKRQLTEKIQHTKTEILIPFRKRDSFFTDKFTRIIKGPEWIDWMDLYLRDRDNFEPVEVLNIIKSIQSFNREESNVELQKKKYIKEFIKKIRDYPTSYFTILAQFISMSDSSIIPALIKQFFIRRQSLTKELGPLLKEIQLYPNTYFQEDRLSEIKAKVMFYLNIIRKNVDMAMKFQHLFFQQEPLLDDDYGQRCDRVCHSVLDFIGHFSGLLFDEDILIAGLECVSTLLVDERSKLNMGMAMSVNRPAVNFAECMISRKCADKLSDFLIKLSNTKQFYEYVRSPDTSIENSRIYPFRYNLKKYLIITKKLSALVPTYWFSEFLKITTKQNFNPKLIYTILSKLKIIPQANQLSPDRPLILESIIDACNSAKFQQQFLEILSCDVTLSNNQLLLKNKILSHEDHPHFIVTVEHQRKTETVLYSLKLLKLLFELQKIADYSRKIAPSHFITRFLSSLRCLGCVERSFTLGVEAIPNLGNHHKNTYRFLANKITPVVGLLGLLGYSKQTINHSAQFANIQIWNHAILSTFNFEKLRTQLQKEKDEIDYQIINDLFVQPQNRYMRNDNHVSSLAYQCLTYFLQQSREISLASMLYTLVQIQAEGKSVTDWNKKFVQNVVAALSSQNLSEGVQAAKFLITLKKNELNRNLANEIFAEFTTKYSLTYASTAFNKYISEFYALSLKYDQYDDKMPKPPLIHLIYSYKQPYQQGWTAHQIKKTLASYQQTFFPVEYSLHQFQRLAKQKEITEIVDYLQMISNLMETVLRMFYKKDIGFVKILRVLANDISKRKLLELVMVFNVEDIIDNGLKIMEEEEVSDQSMGVEEAQKLKSVLDLALRSFDNNPLNNFITYRDTSRQRALQQQKYNVVKYVQQQINKFSRKLYEFLQVFLSFDQTFFANHPVSITQNNPSCMEMFCQLHNEHLPICCDEFFGEDIQASMEVVMELVDSCLVRVNRVKETKLAIDLTSSYLLIDELLNWVHQNSKKITEKIGSQKLKICHRILQQCFNWLGQPIPHYIPAKLLLSIVNIAKNQINHLKKSLIKQTIEKTLQSSSVAPQIKQYMIAILLIFPPDKSENNLIRLVIKMWMQEEKNEYFYNLSRLMLELSGQHSLEMCEANFLTKSARITRIQQSSQGYYSDGLRTADSISWVWILKIVTNLMTSLQNRLHFTKIHFQIHDFFKKSKTRILDILNEPKNQLFDKPTDSSNNIQTKNKCTILYISMAFLDELQATIEFVLSLFRCNMWRLQNRENLEELYYVLIHRTIFLFIGSEDCIMGVRTKKFYRPISNAEKLIWDIDMAKGQEGRDYEGIVDGDMQIEEDFTLVTMTYKESGPKTFLLSMSIRFLDCSKAWMSACSAGMKYSYFTREYFKRSYTLGEPKSNIALKYSLTYWDHISQALVSMLYQDILRIKKANRSQQIDKSLALICDCFKSAELFTELGYLTTLIQIPPNKQKLIESISINISLCLQMCSYHLLSQNYFKNHTGIIQQGGLNTLRKRVFEKINHAKIILNGTVGNQNVKLGEQMFESISR